MAESEDQIIGEFTFEDGSTHQYTYQYLLDLWWKIFQPPPTKRFVRINVGELVKNDTQKEEQETAEVSSRINGERGDAVHDRSKDHQRQ